MGQVARSGDENGLQDMTTPAQTTLLHAAELLEAQASELFEHQDKDQRIAGHKTRADTLTTALELRLLAKRIQDGKAAVSPVPTFEGYL